MVTVVRNATANLFPSTVLCKHNVFIDLKNILTVAFSNSYHQRTSFTLPSGQDYRIAKEHKIKLSKSTPVTIAFLKKS